MKKIVLIVTVVLVAILSIFLINDKKKEQEATAQYEEVDEQIRPLSVKKKQLERELKSLDESYEAERRPKGTTQIVFTELDERVYTECYRIMTPYGFTGILALSLTEYPGAEGCMTVEQFKELIAAGWKPCITWDTETKVSAWWMIITAKIQELGLEMPTTAYFKEGTYTGLLDEALKEKGFTTVIHHGEEHNLIQLAYEEEFWHLGAVGLMGDKPRLRMNEAIEQKGNIAFLVGFEQETELYNENSFTSMLNYFDTYRATEELLVGTVEDASAHYQKRTTEAGDEERNAYLQEKAALEAELAEVIKELEELEAK